jgi:diguanylate cyclase (GGDEF)-like protein
VLPRAVWARAGRPAGILEETRWLFLVLTLISLVLTLPDPLIHARVTGGPVLLASSVVLATSWVITYVRGKGGLFEVVDAVAVFMFTVACEVPSAVFGVLFAAMWFRSLYGSARDAVVRSLLYTGALAAAVAAWPRVVGRSDETELSHMLASLPILYLTVVVGRRMAASLAARERAQAIGGVYSDAARDLIALTDADAIRTVARRADDQVCALVPGLRIMKADRDGSWLLRDGVSGSWVDLPSRLPVAVLGSVVHTAGSARYPVARTVELDAAAGERCAWLCLSLPVVASIGIESWLLVGAPRGVPEDVVAALRSLANHMALAFAVSQAHGELSAQARMDSLTGLANRAAFTDALTAALEGDTEFTSVLFIDLDDFKDVNDRFGHRAGDEALRDVADRLRRATRPSDLCARLGGDEFAVLLADAGEVVAADAARRVAAAIGAQMRRDRDVVRVGASVGAATAPAHSDPELLLHRADAAMYEAKNNRKRVDQRVGPGPRAVEISPRSAG